MTAAKEISRDQILSGIYEVIEDINETFQKKECIKKDENTLLMGSQSTLDSLALVHLVSGVEDWIEETYDVTTVIADEASVANETSPFKSISTLADHIIACLKAEINSLES